jgi:hypothetical protein
MNHNGTIVREASQTLSPRDTARALIHKLRAQAEVEAEDATTTPGQATRLMLPKPEEAKSPLEAEPKVADVTKILKN